MKKSQENKSVFEMLIKSGDGQPIDARPSDFRLPENWQDSHQEGQLAVDVAEIQNDLVIVSTIAGALAEKLEVYLHNDLLTIRGVRISPVDQLSQEDYFHQECYWGKFSRTIVLPVDVKTDLAKAEYNNGVLLIKIPKQKMETKVPIIIVEE